MCNEIGNPCRNCLCRECQNFQTDNCAEDQSLCDICRIEGYTCGTVEHVALCELFVPE